MINRAVTATQSIMKKHEDLLEGVLTRTQRRKLAAFVQKPENFIQISAAPKVQSYAPQSGQIFGILKQMKETFETDLAAAQKEELGNQKAYEELKAAKEKEIETAEAQVTVKTEELAAAKQDLEDTTAQLSADEKYLMNLKEKCALTDKEFEARLKERQLEMEAVSKALAILSSDEAMDTFTRTFNPAFLEKESLTHSKRRAQVAQLLNEVAKKHGDPR